MSLLWQGHISPNCYKKKCDLQNKGRASIAEHGNKGKMKIEIVFQFESQHTPHTMEWMIDSGVTLHMINFDQELKNKQLKAIEILAVDK